ncbi:MAG: hypothetical protein ACFFE8_06150 [Candidatus Heimdallarchaeota archaeon]
MITRELYQADMSVYSDRIVNITPPGGLESPKLPVKRILDASSKYVSPGLIEFHFHLEPTFLMPIE